MSRRPGVSARLKLTLSYAAFLMVAGVGLIAVVWVFLLRYVPDGTTTIPADDAPSLGAPGLNTPGRSDLWAAFAPKAIMFLALLLVLGLAGGWVLAGRMLTPLLRITEATRRTGTGALTHRIRLSGRSDEFRQLADAFDGMMDRLEAHVAEQQRFAANASHELRTPLAITQSLLDVARTDPGHDARALVDTLYEVNTRAIALTEALLLLSRTEQGSFTHEDVDLSLIAEEATETLLPMAEKHGVTIETSGDVATVTGSSALLLQLTTNLVHNAIVHNVPEGGAVWVTTRAHLDRMELTVENTGDVLSAEVVSTLTEPFQRGTQRVHSEQAGTGLGLAIVERIAQAHQGTLILDPRSDGGLRVTLALLSRPLPRRPPAPQ